MDLFLHIIINNLKKLYTVSKSQAIAFPIFNRFKIDLTMTLPNPESFKNEP